MLHSLGHKFYEVNVILFDLKKDKYFRPKLKQKITFLDIHPGNVAYTPIILTVCKWKSSRTLIDLTNFLIIIIYNNNSLYYELLDKIQCCILTLYFYENY